VNERGLGFDMDSGICRYLFVTELKMKTWYSCEI